MSLFSVFLFNICHFASRATLYRYSFGPLQLWIQQRVNSYLNDVLYQRSVVVLFRVMDG